MIKLIEKNQGKSKNITDVFIEGKVMYARVHTPRTKYQSEEKEFSLNVELTETELKQLKTLGLNKKKQLVQKSDADGGGTFTDEEGKTYLQVKLPEISSTGNIQKVLVINKARQPFTDLIGNGSTAIVQLTLLPFTNAFGSGVSTRLRAVQVLTHVPFESTNTLSAAFVNETDDFVGHTGGLI